MQIPILLKAGISSLKNGTNTICYQDFCWLIFCWTTNQWTNFQLQFSFPTLCLVLPRKGTVLSSFHFPLGICRAHLKGMRRADVIGHYYSTPQLRLMYSASPAIFFPTLCHVTPGLCLHLWSPNPQKLTGYASVHAPRVWACTKVEEIWGFCA